MHGPGQKLCVSFKYGNYACPARDMFASFMITSRPQGPTNEHHHFILFSPNLHHPPYYTILLLQTKKSSTPTPSHQPTPPNSHPTYPPNRQRMTDMTFPPPHPLLKPPPDPPPPPGTTTAVDQDVQQAVNSAFELTSDAVSASVAVKMSNSARQTVLQQCLVGGGLGVP